MSIDEVEEDARGNRYPRWYVPRLVVKAVGAVYPFVVLKNKTERTAR